MKSTWFRRQPRPVRPASRSRLGLEELEARLVRSTLNLLSISPSMVSFKDLLPPPAPATFGLNGADAYLMGVNLPWVNDGYDFTASRQGDVIDQNFQALHDQGVKVARWWLFDNGNGVGMFDGQGNVQPLGQDFSNALEANLQSANDHGIRLLLTVFDYSVMFPEDRGGHPSIITDPGTRQNFLQTVFDPLVQEVAASPNKNAVLGYDIINEPENYMQASAAPYHDFWGGDQGLQEADVRSFVAACTADIHALGGGALATVGSAKPDWVGSYAGLGLDFYTVHYYPDNWEKPIGADPGSALPTCDELRAAHNLEANVPVIVGEFPTVVDSYDTADHSPYSAEWYLDTIHAKGYAGALAWSVLAQDQPVNESNWAAFQPAYLDWINNNLAAAPQGSRFWKFDPSLFRLQTTDASAPLSSDNTPPAGDNQPLVDTNVQPITLTATGALDNIEPTLVVVSPPSVVNWQAPELTSVATIGFWRLY
jgi:hypothetical protein